MEVREEVRQLAAPLAEEAGYELVDVELVVQGRHRIIRVLLDKPGGVTVGDCARFSRRLADCLDMNQTVRGQLPARGELAGHRAAAARRSRRSRASPGQRASRSTTHEPRDGRRQLRRRAARRREASASGVRTEDGEEHWFDWAEVKSARRWSWIRGRRGRHAARRSRDAGGSR